jgi:hypothetical protein
MNPHIVALQSAEQQLRDHDKRIADAAAELKALKLDRKDIAARVAQCIDVLCGRGTPDLFAAVDEPAAAVPTPSTTANAPVGDPSAWADLAASPMICDPVGAGRLADIAGLTKEDIACLSAVGLNTLADLERVCQGNLDSLADALGWWPGVFTKGTAEGIQWAIEQHLKPATVPPEPAGVRYPTDDAWRKQGLALLGLNEKLLKACKKEEVLTVGDLHDWIDEETRGDGGFFGPGVLARELSRIGKIAAKWGVANAEIIYQFLADYGFAGVPKKEAA